MTQPNTPSSSPDRIFAPRKSKGYDFSVAITSLRTASEDFGSAILQERRRHSSERDREGAAGRWERVTSLQGRPQTPWQHSRVDAHLSRRMPAVAPR